MDIKDYLHLFLGCNCQVEDEQILRLTGISYDGTQNCWWAYFEGTELSYSSVKNVKPILRQLSDINEEEAIHCANLSGVCSHLAEDSKASQFMFLISSNKFYTAQTNITGIAWVQIITYLLSKGFDLFGLIQAGLAIDETKL